MGYYKAFIRVVKSMAKLDAFGVENVIEERLLEGESKEDIKLFLLNKYPQFFSNQKVYEKETKDKAQFFYVVIYPLYQWEIGLLNSGQWVCANCGQVHTNKYISRPKIEERLFGDKMFCRSEENFCLESYKRNYYNNVEFPDDTAFIKRDSPNYIYKITEKSTNKSYIGKTRNAPFFRWWNHLTHSSSPFGLYLRKTSLSDWTFEVLEILPPEIEDKEVFRIESSYIREYDSIQNGFNSLISCKSVYSEESDDEPKLVFIESV